MRLCSAPLWNTTAPQTTSWTPPTFWLQVVAPDLKSDLALIWPDFVQVAGMRGAGRVLEHDLGELQWIHAGSSDIARCIDIVFSKYGYAPSHHFFHWRAKSKLDGDPTFRSALPATHANPIQRWNALSSSFHYDFSCLHQAAAIAARFGREVFAKIRWT
jgi:hypothetical protein